MKLPAYKMLAGLAHRTDFPWKNHNNLSQKKKRDSKLPVDLGLGLQMLKNHSLT